MTTQISSCFTKHWTKFLTHQTCNAISIVDNTMAWHSTYRIRQVRHTNATMYVLVYSKVQNLDNALTAKKLYTPGCKSVELKRAPYVNFKLEHPGRVRSYVISYTYIDTYTWYYYCSVVCGWQIWYYCRYLRKWLSFVLWAVSTKKMQLLVGVAFVVGQ